MSKLLYLVPSVRAISGYPAGKFNRQTILSFCHQASTATYTMTDLSTKWIKVSKPIPHVLHLELSRFSSYDKLCPSERLVR
jgi:hypothetical protein